MKQSRYNFIWPTDIQEKVMIFNSLTTSLVEVGKTNIELLNLPEFDYDSQPDSAKDFINALKQGGFVLDDSVDELRILKFAYNSIKYDQMSMAIAIAPTLRCNLACTYCYEHSDENQDKRDGQHVFMPENIQQALLDYIENAAKTLKSLHIVWYGGEPLLAKKLAFNLSEKIIAIAEANKINYSADMITNGYLLGEDPNIIQNLRDCRIESFQITLDGPPEVHNNRRMLKGNRGPTFDRILEGIKFLTANEFDVSLRINIDQSNIDAALRLLDILEDNHLKDISLYLGRVNVYSKGCKTFESSCTTIEEFTLITQTFHETLRLRGFKRGQIPYYPQIALPCCANRMNTFVIDPDGDMYKCLVEIGDKHARMGNIMNFSQRTKHEHMREIQWLTWEPFEYSDCRACKLLPICMADKCGYRAMYVNDNRPSCGAWKYSLEHYVRAHFSREKEVMEAV
jgi:uncharacterized protein